MIYKIITGVANLFFSFLQLMTVVFVTCIMLPPTIFYVFLPIELIISTRPLFALWYQWAHVIKWVLDFPIYTFFNREEADTISYRSSSNVLFILHCLDFKSFWAILFLIGPEPFFVEEHSIRNTNRLIRIFLIRLMRLIRMKDVCEGIKFKSVFFGNSKQIECYIMEQVCCIRRKYKSIMIISPQFGYKPKYIYSVTILVGNYTISDQVVTMSTLVQAIYEEMRYCHLLD